MSHKSLPLTALAPLPCICVCGAFQAASVDMMSSKDARVSLMGELLRHLAIVKALGWEEVLADKVRGVGYGDGGR